jgi:hypothetical protein
MVIDSVDGPSCHACEVMQRTGSSTNTSLARAKSFAEPRWRLGCDGSLMREQVFELGRFHGDPAPFTRQAFLVPRGLCGPVESLEMCASKLRRPDARMPAFRALLSSCRFICGTQGCLHAAVGLAVYKTKCWPWPRKGQSDKSKCWHCSRKCGLIGISCRCGYVFCSRHRYPEEHNCSFDHKAFGVYILAKSLLL